MSPITFYPHHPHHGRNVRLIRNGIRYSYTRQGWSELADELAKDAAAFYGESKWRQDRIAGRCFRSERYGDEAKARDLHIVKNVLQPAARYNSAQALAIRSWLVATARPTAEGKAAQ